MNNFSSICLSNAQPLYACAEFLEWGTLPLVRTYWVFRRMWCFLICITPLSVASPRLLQEIENFPALHSGILADSPVHSVPTEITTPDAAHTLRPYMRFPVVIIVHTVHSGSE